MGTARWRRIPALLAAGMVVVAAAAVGGLGTQAAAASAGPAAKAKKPKAVAMQDVVPVPASVTSATGVTYTLAAQTNVYTIGDATPVAQYLAGALRPATGYALPVLPPPPGGPGIAKGIWLLPGGTAPSVGDQGYQLDVSADEILLRGNTAAGLFAGAQTLRQLFPAAIEKTTVQTGPWTVPGGSIVDQPRFGYRGAMLDVARHFFPVTVVERYIDEISRYKINYLHLHLSDDQGWRIVINSWPKLATVGGVTAVGGGPGGYYTQADYQAIVAYAQARYITVVPEIDMPGHVNAALTSYAELNCDGKAPPPYTGTDVGFSSLCTGKDITYTFIDDVVRELAAVTPGPYLHVGGDEADATKPADYATFMNRVQQTVAAHGKSALAWHQIVDATPAPGTIAQYWDTTTNAPNVAAAAAKGTKLVMSPANKAYLDMKYTKKTKLGQNWAGYIEVKTAYNWDPGAFVNGVPESAVFGVEAPLWTETITTLADIEYMAFPRLPAIAELGWSPAATHNWTAFSKRLADQGPRWAAQNINFYRSPQVPWAS